MTNTTNQGHGLNSRIIMTAAILVERFVNPEVAAYRRAQGGARHRAGRYIVAPSSERREQFWFSVGRALGAAYHYTGCPTDYERAVKRDINAARALLKSKAV